MRVGDRERDLLDLVRIRITGRSLQLSSELFSSTKKVGMRTEVPVITRRASVQYSSMIQVHVLVNGEVD